MPKGSDKPFKYISMFECADIIVLNKCDIAPYIKFDFNEFEKGVRAVNQKAPIIKISCTTGEGVKELINVLK